MLSVSGGRSFDAPFRFVMAAMTQAACASTVQSGY
jgi:hypothetical protein